MLPSRMLLYVLVSFPCDAARHETIHHLVIRIFLVVYLDKAAASRSKRKKLNRGNRGASGDTEGDIDPKKKNPDKSRKRELSPQLSVHQEVLSQAAQEVPQKEEEVQSSSRK